MEDNQILDNAISSSEGMTVSSASMVYLREIGKWAKFFAVIGFIGIGFMVLVGLFFSSIMGSLASMGGNALPGMAATGLGFIYVIFAAIMVIPTIYLNKFANFVSTAIRSNDSHMLEMAFEKFKSYYKFNGILVIIVLGIYALVFIIDLFGGLMSAF